VRNNDPRLEDRMTSRRWASQLRNPHPTLWQTRAPYAKFLEEFELLNKFYSGSRLSYALTRSSVASLPASARTEESIGAILGGAAKRDAKKYARQVPDVCDLLRELQLYEMDLDEAVLVRLSSLFEAFTLCWACNMFLAILEAEGELSDEQTKLVDRIVGKGRAPFGGLTPVVQVFPDMKAVLGQAPRRMRDPRTGRLHEGQLTADVGALQAVDFWRNFRNLVVHGGRYVTGEFIRNHGHVWNVLRQDLYRIPPIRVGQPVPLSVTLITASFTNHQILAKAMRDSLIQVSGAKRGHVFAPGPFRGRVPPHEMPSVLPPLRTDGDWT
jgi:hypothetical protein